MNRRALALGVVGAAAAAAGLAAALWHGRRPQREDPAGAAASGTSGAAADPAVGGDTAGPAGLFDLRFTQPGGQALALARFRGRPLLLNFWATWCPPCIREMPALDRFAREFGPAGWQVVGIAVDQDKPVREFLERNPVSYPIALAGFDGIALSRSLGNEQGGLPFTVAVDAGGRITHRHAGETRFEQLATWAAPPRGLAPSSSR